MKQTVVIIGAGQGGVEVAATLRARQFDGDIVIIGDEPDQPYQRPPLSKEFIKGGGKTESVQLQSEGFYTANNIELRLDQAVTRIEPAARKVMLAGGEAVFYDHLVLATGARNRKLGVPGLDDPAIIQLRTLAHARRLLDSISTLRSVIIVGGGFIGLEVASLLRAHDVSVELIEASDRLMGRAVSPPTSAHFRRYHETTGAKLRFNTFVQEVEQKPDGWGVALSDGTSAKADAVLVAAGVVPNSELAEAAGLAVANGIVVDAQLRTSDPAISAIGDCAAYASPYADGAIVRLESVQNAVDQARCVAARLTGEAKPYEGLPWFWSYQGDARLQIAGLAASSDQEVIRGDPQGDRFSVFLYRGGRNIAVESINDPGGHMVARRLLANGITVSPEMAADPQSDLKALIKRPA